MNKIKIFYPIRYLVRRIRGIILIDKKGQKGIVLNRYSVLWRYDDEFWNIINKYGNTCLEKYFIDDCHDYGKITGFRFLTKKREKILKKIGGLK